MQKKKLIENLSDDESDDGDVKMKEEGKKVFANKNTVSKTKMENKRSQKEAIKKIKQKRTAGTTNVQQNKEQKKTV